MSQFESGLSKLEQVLEACGGVAFLAEVTKEFTKCFSVYFDQKWRERHFGYQSLASLANMDSVDKVISLTRCEDYFFLVISKGSSDDTEDTGCKRAKGRETPNPEAQLRQALTVCGGRATFEKLNTTFQKLFETSFTWKGSTPCKNNHNPGFPENIKVEKNTKGKKFWTFSIDPLPKVGVPVQFELKQQGLSQLLQALAYFGEFCKSRQLKKYFSTWLKADFETEWILKHFGVKDVYSLAFVPEVSAKICILPKDEKNKRFCFQLNGVDRVEAGVSQLKDALEACGGAATLDELKKKFLEKFYTPCDSLWMKSTFGVENYTILESVPSFKSCVIFCKTECLLLTLFGACSKLLRTRVADQRAGSSILKTKSILLSSFCCKTKY